MWPSAFAERLQLPDCSLDDMAVDVEFGVARGGVGTRAVDVGTRAVETDHIGLEALEAAPRDLFAESDEIIERADRIGAGPFLDPLGMPGAVGAAMRPV